MLVSRPSDPSGVILMSPQCLEGFSLRDKGEEDMALEALWIREGGI